MVTFKDHHYGYTSDFCFMAGFLFMGIFLFFGAYNPAGEGIVLFKNRDHENYTSTATRDDDNFNHINRNFYVGFDRICFPDSLRHDADAAKLATNTATTCLHYNAGDFQADHEFTLLIWLTWLMFCFSIVHFLIKRAAMHNVPLLSNFLTRRGSLSGGFRALLFWIPIVFFIVSCIYWDAYLKNTDVIPTKDGVQKKELVNEYSTDEHNLDDLNGALNPYKDTEHSPTWSVVFLLMGGGFQAVACILVLVRSQMMEDGQSLINVRFGEAQNIGSPIGSQVDAAAKNPETKTKVTSVYSNRRVTNGIQF